MRKSTIIIEKNKNKNKKKIVKFFKIVYTSNKQKNNYDKRAQPGDNFLHCKDAHMKISINLINLPTNLRRDSFYDA